MAAGELIGCFGLTEPEAGSDPASMTTTARRDGGGGWVINGARRWIGLASIADIAIRRFPFPAGPGRRPGRGRAGLPAAQVGVGQGVCPRGVARAIGQGFPGFGAQRVVAEAMAVNTASRRVMEKAGLTLVRTFYQP